MVRLKFVLFALVALALLLGQLFVLTPPVSGRGEALALEAARSASAAARAEVLGLKAQVLEAALAVRALPEAQQALGAGRSTPAERLTPLAAVARQALPEPLREAAVLGLVEGGTLVLARGGEAPVAAPEALDAQALAQAGGSGTVVELFSALHLAVSAPGAGGSALLVAVPLEAPGLAALAPPGGTLGLALLAGGKPVAQAGATPAAGALATLMKSLKPGSAGVVERGGTQSMGPLRLPLLTRAEDTTGGAAPLQVAARREVLPGLEAVALVSTEPMMAALAGGQRFTLFATAALLVLAAVWTVLMGGGARASAAQTTEEAAGAEESDARELPPANLLPLPEAAPAAQAAPEDFQFGQMAAAAGAYGAAEEPAPAFAQAAGGYAAEPAYAAESSYAAEPAYGSHEAAAAAAPAYTAYAEPEPAPLPPAPAWGGAAPAPRAADPFAMVAPQAESGYSYEDNPDATRVATVPDELLRASASAMATSATVPSWAAPARPLQAVPQVAPPVVDPEEQHFRDVYQEFVSTRERCGEPADGLTYEKFALKLRKNREQLVQKYACRTVRFQVYVKEGKAALKATPIKD